MEYRNLGQTGLRVSSLCLGTMTFGEPDEKSFMHKIGCSEATSFEIMNRAAEAGVNFFDTADIYGNDGLTEKVLGRWFRSEGRRDDIVLATKFRFKTNDGPNGGGASRYRIMKCVEDSLRRLQTDRIDLYQIHCQDLNVPEEETLRALDDLVRQGKVLYIGCSNYTGYRLMDSLAISEKNGWERFATLQAKYNLVSRGLERELTRVCANKGVGILPWSPLEGGFLSGKYVRDDSAPEGSRLAKWGDAMSSLDNDRSWKIIDAVKAVAGELDATPAQVSLAWLLRQPSVSSVIFGARKMSQLEDNISAAELTLSDDQLKRLTDASDFEPGYPYNFIRMVSGGAW